MMRKLWRESFEAILKMQGEPVIEWRSEDSQNSEILSAANLWMRALERKRILTRQGLRPGDLLCESGDSRDLPVNLVACAIGHFVYWPLRRDQELEFQADGAEPQGGPRLFVWKSGGGEAQAGRHPLFRPELIREDTVLCLTSSGTEGRPKLVSFSAPALFHQIRSFNAAGGVRAGDSRLIVLPFFHCFGLIMDLISGLFAMQTLYIRNTGPFHPERILKLIHEEKIRHLSVVPRMLELLCLKAELSPRYQQVLASVKVHVGGAVLSMSLKDRAQKLFGEVIEGYGMTECAGGVLLKGRPNQCEVRLKPSASDSVFELWVKTPSLGEFEGREKRMDPEGFFNTGDLVTEVSGGLRVVGRSSGLFKSTSGLWTDLETLQAQIEKRFSLKIHGLEYRQGRLSLVAPVHGPEVPEIEEFVQMSYGTEIEIFNWEDGWQLEEILAGSRGKGSSEAVLEWVRKCECKAS